MFIRATFFCFIAMICMSLFSGQTINADSIFLTNDYVIYGKVVAFKPDATK
jgi:hypothetical protein